MAGLIDQFGRPLKKQELVKELAAPGVTGVRPVWVESIASGLTPSRLSAILKEAAEGDLEAYLTLAEEMEERDAHYASVLGVRKRRVSGIDPVIEASEDPRGQEVAEAVKADILDHYGFADLVEDLLDALGKGFSVVEIMWETGADRWRPAAFAHRDARFFQPDPDDPRTIHLRDDRDTAKGLPLARSKFVTHRAKLKSGHWARGGLARLVAFGWICKAYTLKDWMAFVEVFGHPIRIGKYGPQATKADVEVLMRAVANLGTDAAAVLPESMRIDLERASGGSGGAGSTDVFEKLARWVDEQVSKAVLGQTMTADDGSSMAQAEVHNDVRLDIARADAKSVAATIQRDLIAPYVALNFGSVDAAPILSLPVEEPEDNKTVLAGTAMMVKLGLAVKADEVRSKLGYSKPGEDDEIIGGGPTAPAPDDATAMNRASPEVSNEVELEKIVDGEWETLDEELMGPLLAALDKAEGYGEAQALIDQAFAGSELIPDGKLVERLVMANVRARGLGDQRDG
ncbi:MAG: DUF935 domain-containing protein [Shimia sp.]